VVIVLGVVVWLAPIMVAHSPLLHWVLARAAVDLHGSVSTGSASLGWFSPVGLSELEVRDTDGKLVLKVPAVTSERSLASILWNLSRPGKFRIEKPRLDVVLRPDGSNVEDLVAEYLLPSDRPTPEIQIEIVDATAVIHDHNGRREWTIEKLQLTLSTSPDPAKPFALRVSGVIPEPEGAGRFDVALEPVSGKGENPSSGSRLTVRTDAVSLEKFDVLLARFGPEMTLRGRLSSTIKCEWSGGPSPRIALDTNATITDLTLAAPRLRSDQVQMKSLAATCRLALQDGTFNVEQASLDCDLGKVSLVGSLGWDAPGADVPSAAKRASPGIGWLLHQTYELHGQVDLARLAAMLPGTLHIHENTTVTSGRLTLDLVSRRGEEGMVWEGRVETSDLTAMRRGQELVWQQPIVLTVAAHETRQGPVVQRLTCRSHFLEANLAGTPENIEASLNFDLDRLVHRLGGFVDLGRLRMAGAGWANLNWKRSPQNDFELDADLQVRNLMLAVGGHDPQHAPWTEENLLVFLSATGRTDFAANTRLNTAELEVKAGEEHLVARLTQPVETFEHGGRWPVAVDGRGELARWITRARSWFALDGWNIEGTYRLRAEGIGSAAGIELQSSRLGVANLRVVGPGLNGPGLNIAEPEAQLALAGRYDHAHRRLLLKQLELRSTALSVRGDDVILGVPRDAPLELAGELSYRGDIDRLQQWFADAAQPPTWRAAGQIAGQGRLRYVAGMTTGQIDTTIQNLLLRNTSGKQFHQPHTRLVARGAYDSRAKLIKLEKLQLTSDLLGAEAAGRIRHDRTPTDVQVAGRINYDLGKLSGLLQPYVGNGVHVAGTGSREFSFQGPLALADARANATLGWTRAYFYGFRIGPGELHATLSGGTLHVQPLELDVSGGRLNIAAQMRLAPGPAELHVQPGPLVRQVRIDPEMCAYGLQYIAPILAGVATAEGLFSIDLEHCRIPIDRPDRSDLAGRFTVHSIQVGPGPLVRELAVLLARADVARLTRESVVHFRMIDGRVYHQGLELVFPDLTIRTHGSVGLDQTLAMVAEMPIPPKWFAGRTLRTALANQRIQVPIRGTLQHPQIDHRKLDEYNRQLLGNAARNMLEEELDNQLNRLLNPRR
jgi:hypothetical protein